MLTSSKRLILILFVLSFFVPNAVQAQGKSLEPVEINEIWNFKLEKKDFGETYLGNRMDFIYTNSAGGEFTSMTISDPEGGRLLQSSFRIPMHSNIRIETPLMLSQPELMDKLFNFGIETPKEHADLPVKSGSTVSLNKVAFETVGFKKPTGIGMFDLIFGDWGYKLKLVDGPAYAPLSYEEFELADVSLANLLKKKFKVRRLTVEDGKVTDSNRHHRNGSLVFEEKTMLHPESGIHKHYTFYSSSDLKKPFLTWSIQQNGEFAYLEKEADSQILFYDKQSDGHYEWMIFQFDDREELIDTSDPWHIKLAAEEKYLAFLDYGKAVEASMGDVSKQYMKAKESLQVENGEEN